MAVRDSVTVVDDVNAAPSLITIEPVGATVSKTMVSEYVSETTPAQFFIW